MGAVGTTGRWADLVTATGEDAAALVAEAGALAAPTVVVTGDAVSADLLGAGHIVLDTSSLSGRRVFTALCQLLDRERDGRFDGEIQVLLHPFAPDPEGGGPGCGPVQLWMPVLTEGAGPGLAALYSRLRPEEVFPVLPFPAKNPRRADDLVLEHRALLAEMGVDLRAAVHAHEDDPSDLYRTLLTVSRRAQGYGAVAPTTLAVTPGDDPALALGAFLAAYECEFPIAWPPGGSVRRPLRGQPICAWIAGAPYRTAA